MDDELIEQILDYYYGDEGAPQGAAEDMEVVIGLIRQHDHAKVREAVDNYFDEKVPVWSKRKRLQVWLDNYYGVVDG